MHLIPRRTWTRGALLWAAFNQVLLLTMALWLLMTTDGAARLFGIAALVLGVLNLVAEVLAFRRARTRLLTTVEGLRQ